MICVVQHIIVAQYAEFALPGYYCIIVHMVNLKVLFPVC